MEHRDEVEPNAPRRPARIIEMRKMIDDRDETIRLLNEALSRALDELRRTHAA